MRCMCEVLDVAREKYKCNKECISQYIVFIAIIYLFIYSHFEQTATGCF